MPRFVNYGKKPKKDERSKMERKAIFRFYREIILPKSQRKVIPIVADVTDADRIAILA